MPIELFVKDDYTTKPGLILNTTILAEAAAEVIGRLLPGHMCEAVDIGCVRERRVSVVAIEFKNLGDMKRKLVEVSRNEAVQVLAGVNGGIVIDPVFSEGCVRPAVGVIIRNPEARKECRT